MEMLYESTQLMFESTETCVLCVVVVGPRYILDDLTVRYVSRLEPDASGVVGECRTDRPAMLIGH